MKIQPITEVCKQDEASYPQNCKLLSSSCQVNDHFDCFTSNIACCITCSFCNKRYIEETGRKLGERFSEYLLGVKNIGPNLAKPVARQFNLLGHSNENVEICRLHPAEDVRRLTRRKNKTSFQVQTRNLSATWNQSMNGFHSTSFETFLNRLDASIEFQPMARPDFSIRVSNLMPYYQIPDEGLTLETSVLDMSLWRKTFHFNPSWSNHI